MLDRGNGHKTFWNLNMTLKKKQCEYQIIFLEKNETFQAFHCVS